MAPDAPAQRLRSGVLTVRQQFRVVGRFVLVGPLIGAAVAALLLLAMAGRAFNPTAQESFASWSLTFIAFGLPFIVGLGYYYGGVAALLTGAVAAWLLQRTITPLRVLAVVGTAAGLAFVNYYALNPLLDQALVASGCGALSAGVCIGCVVVPMRDHPADIQTATQQATEQRRKP